MGTNVIGTEKWYHTRKSPSGDARLAKWPKAAVCKAVWGNPHAGSNPALRSKYDDAQVAQVEERILGKDEVARANRALGSII